MQKKLIVAAVAGALAAPAAFAQTSVTIYGTLFPSFESAASAGGDANGAPTAASTTLQSSVRGATPAGTAAALNASGAYTGNPANLGSRTRTQSAGSNIGFRVREDLGGGMYMNAQIQLTVGALGGISPPVAGTLSYAPQFQETFVGIGTNNWGEVKFGSYLTPWTINQGAPAAHTPYYTPSINFGGALLGGLSIVGNSAVSTQEISNFCNGGTSVAAAIAGPTIVAPAATFTNTAASCLAAGTVFSRRMPNTVQWWSPSWSGFDLKLMYAAEQLRQAQNVTPTTLDPYLWSATVNYSGGPLNVGLGYQRHHDFTAFAVRSYAGGLNGTFYLGGSAVPGGGLVNTTAQISGTTVVGAGGITGSTDDAWNLRANYTWGGFTLGGYWERLHYNNSYDAIVNGNIVSMQRSAYRIDGAYATGPHTFGLQYARTNDLSGSVAGTNRWNGANTNAVGWAMGYGYTLSKRSGVFLYHTRITNDTNSRYGGIVFGALATANGADPRYTGVGFRHTF